MSTTTKSVPTAPPPRRQSVRDQFLQVYEEEHAKTVRVLEAYPREKGDLRPHARSKTALELAWMFVLEQGAVEKALTTGFDWTRATEFPDPKPPASLDLVIEAFRRGHTHVSGLISGQRDEELHETIQFPIGPGRIGDLPKIQFLWLMLHDQIHHRGQFSVYLRMADARVPSIYGPSADEKWF